MRDGMYYRPNNKDTLFGTPRILAVGCGGAGNNCVTRLTKKGIVGAETIALNTDYQAIEICEADKKILIGKTVTRGLGAGGDPFMAKKAAEASEDVIKDVLSGAHLVFITAGMGGGTGTGSAPVVAEIAKRLGAIVVGIVTTPFKIERERRLKGEFGLERLRVIADSVIVLDNNRLMDLVGNQPISDAFGVMDNFIAEIIKGVTETITQPSLINLDYADIRAIMSRGGVATMFYGRGVSQDPDGVVKDALSHPLLDVDLKGATGALVHITGGKKLSLKCAEEIAEGLTKYLNDDANVILGARIHPAFKDQVQVMSIMTGVTSTQVLGPGANNRRGLPAKHGRYPRQASIYQAPFAQRSDTKWDIPWIN